MSRRIDLDYTWEPPLKAESSSESESKQIQQPQPPSAPYGPGCNFKGQLPSVLGQDGTTRFFDPDSIIKNYGDRDVIVKLENEDGTVEEKVVKITKETPEDQSLLRRGLAQVSRGSLIRASQFTEMSLFWLNLSKLILMTLVFLYLIFRK